MGKRKVDPAKKRAAIARVLSGTSSYGDEEKRTGLKKSTLHEAAQKLKPGAPDPQPGPKDSPLEAARKKLGTSTDPKKPLTPDELKLAGPDAARQDGDYCVATISQIKTLLTLGAAAVCRVPPIDERVFKAGQLGDQAKEAVRVASPELAPLLRKYLPEGSALVGLAVVLILDSVGTAMALNEIRIEYKEKRAAEKAARDAARKAAQEKPAA